MTRPSAGTRSKRALKLSRVGPMETRSGGTATSFLCCIDDAKSLISGKRSTRGVPKKCTHFFPDHVGRRRRRPAGARVAVGAWKFDPACTGNMVRDKARRECRVVQVERRCEDQGGSPDLLQGERRVAP